MAYKLFNGIKSRKARGGHTILGESVRKALPNEDASILHLDEKPPTLIKDKGYSVIEDKKPSSLIKDMGYTITENDKPSMLIKDAGYSIIEDEKPHVNSLTGKVSNGGGNEPPTKTSNERPSDDADKVNKKKKINESVLASLVPATFSGIGDLFRITGKFGGMNNNDSPNPLTPLANIATEIGLQSSIHDVSAGLGHQTKELIDEIGAVDTPGWAKLQLLEKLMQNRDAAFQRRLQYGFNR